MLIKYNNFLLTSYKKYDGYRYKGFYICFRRCIDIGLCSNDLYIAYYFIIRKSIVIKILYRPALYSDYDTFMAYDENKYYVDENCRFNQEKYQDIINLIRKILFIYKINNDN